MISLENTEEEETVIKKSTILFNSIFEFFKT